MRVKIELSSSVTRSLQEDDDEHETLHPGVQLQLPEPNARQGHIQSVPYLVPAPIISPMVDWPSKYNGPPLAVNHELSFSMPTDQERSQLAEQGRMGRQPVGKAGAEARTGAELIQPARLVVERDAEPDGRDNEQGEGDEEFGLIAVGVERARRKTLLDDRCARLCETRQSRPCYRDAPTRQRRNAERHWWELQST